MSDNERSLSVLDSSATFNGDLISDISVNKGTGNSECSSVDEDKITTMLQPAPIANNKIENVTMMSKPSGIELKCSKQQKITNLLKLKDEVNKMSQPKEQLKENKIVKIISSPSNRRKVVAKSRVRIKSKKIEEKSELEKMFEKMNNRKLDKIDVKHEKKENIEKSSEVLKEEKKNKVQEITNKFESMKSSEYCQTQK